MDQLISVRLLRILSLQVEKTEDQLDPRFCIFRNEKCDHLPPTLFIVAEIDTLRDESYGIHNISRSSSSV